MAFPSNLHRCLHVAVAAAAVALFAAESAFSMSAPVVPGFGVLPAGANVPASLPRPLFVPPSYVGGDAPHGPLAELPAATRKALESGNADPNLFLPKPVDFRWPWSEEDIPDSPKDGVTGNRRELTEDDAKDSVAVAPAPSKENDPCEQEDCVNDKKGFLRDDFEWSVSTSGLYMQLSKEHGGFHGLKFDDREKIGDFRKVRVTGITLYAPDGQPVHGFQLSYSIGQPLMHGKSAGNFSSITLVNGEKINWLNVHLCKRHRHTRICGIEFYTDQQSIRSGIQNTHDSVQIIANDGYDIRGFYGAEGNVVDRVGAIAVLTNTAP